MKNFVIYQTDHDMRYNKLKEEVAELERVEENEED